MQEDRSFGSCGGSWEMELHMGLRSLDLGIDHLPALTDHHADPGHGAPAVFCAPLPHGRGKAATSHGTCAGQGEPQGNPNTLSLAPPPPQHQGRGILLVLYSCCSGSAPSFSSLHTDLCGLISHTTHSLPLSLCLLQKDLLGIQLLLNASETSLHQLMAMLDCRGLHKVLG